ncbi:hypothetical protein [uncultured Paracoccus sp.]|uniref:hypothetical protein n=1 Tax=uncultured Paracoccus sp. TaxID=189685 RepID=UPI00261D4806|nr:hypothetical protein [uncultured Paracoccus sp.]
MSNNEGGLERSGRRHKPAIIGIIVAVSLAVLAFLFFAPMGGDEEDVETTEQLAPGTDALAPEGTAATGTATAPVATD